MKVKIPHRWNSAPCFVADVADASTSPMRDAVEQAVAAGADLTGARLTDARLTDADLTGANLTGARLTDARLTDADLTGANLTDADLTGANLTDADLTGARLTGANLTGARLTDADLTGARLTGARLTGADLTGARLTGARDDFRAVLDAAPNEVAGLLLAVREGRIDGSHYEGSCACLKGTIANIRHCSYLDLGADYALQADSSRPSERLFMAISPGHTPAINPVAKIVEGWILEWQAEHANA